MKGDFMYQIERLNHKGEWTADPDIEPFRTKKAAIVEMQKQALQYPVFCFRVTAMTDLDETAYWREQNGF
jgi:hypothetical protein